MTRTAFALGLALLTTAFASRAEDLLLPAHVCNDSVLFAGGFETFWAPQDSGGAGGATGAVQRSVFVPGIGTRTYQLYVPAGAESPMPLVIALHGAAGPGQAGNAAAATRDNWSGFAQASGFAVLAPVASGAQGGWVPEVDFPTIDTLLDDARSAYALDLSRTHLWGFSAGGHVAHAMALLRDPDRYAAYAVNAGVLEAYAGTTAPQQALREVPVMISIGTSDSLYPFAQADRDRFLAAGWSLGSSLQFAPFAGGHTYGAAQLAAIGAYFCPRAVLP